MERQFSNGPWRELRDRCERIKAEDQHHETIKANQFYAIHQAAQDLIALGNYCPKKIARNCSYSDLEEYIKK